jgi:hypothetical protein
MEQKSKFVVLLDKRQTKEEITTGNNGNCFLPWNKITPSLRKLLGLYRGEVLTGVIIDENGINVKYADRHLLKNKV